MEKVNNKLFCWITILAFLGGGLNAFAVLNFSFTSSHMTGSITKISVDLINKDITESIVLLSIVFSFFLGAIISGILIGNGREFELRKRYGEVFIIIGIILKILADNIYGTQKFLCIITFFLGLQNGLFIRYKGMVIRTTHMTGTITDLGVEIGHLIRGNKEIIWKIKYYATNVLSFFLGGVIVGIGYEKLDSEIFDYVSLAYIFSGLYYFFLRFKYYSSRQI